MNIYRHQFVSVCPNNGDVIIYALEIESDSMIQVEHITTQAKLCRLEASYHEKIADAFFERFGGRQTIKGHHHGVDIETRRGFDDPDFGRLTTRVTIGSTVYEKGVEAINAIKAISRGGYEQCACR